MKHELGESAKSIVSRLDNDELDVGPQVDLEGKRRMNNSVEEEASRSRPESRSQSKSKSYEYGQLAYNQKPSTAPHGASRPGRARANTTGTTESTDALDLQVSGHSTSQLLDTGGVSKENPKTAISSSSDPLSGLRLCSQGGLKAFCQRMVSEGYNIDLQEELDGGDVGLGDWDMGSPSKS